MATEAPQAVPASPTREEVNARPYGTAILIIEESWSRGLTMVNWEYEPFDLLSTANTYAADLRAWADQEAEDYGEECYITVVFKAVSGSPLEVKSVQAHGFTDTAAERSVAAVVYRDIDTILFSDKVWSYDINWKEGDQPAKVEPEVVKPTKGVAEKGAEPLVKPKPIRKPAAKRVTEAEAAPAPQARRKRPAPANKIAQEGDAPLVRSRGIRSKVKADRKVS